MPRMTDREKLAKLEAEQRSLADEAEKVRKALRSHYGEIAGGLAVETLSEREFKDLLTLAIRIGGAKAIAVLKAVPAAS